MPEPPNEGGTLPLSEPSGNFAAHEGTTIQRNAPFDLSEEAIGQAQTDDEFNELPPVLQALLTESKRSHPRRLKTLHSHGLCRLTIQAEPLVKSNAV